MKQYATSSILNLALLGHAGSGKTTLCDALLFAYGQAERIGRTEDGTTVMDFDAEEKKRACSISCAAMPLEAEGLKVNLLDTPGSFDFAGEAVEGLSAADTALVVISGKSGLTVGARQSFESAREAGKATAIFVGKLNSTHAHFYRVVSSLTARYGAAICPVMAPLYEGENLVAFFDMIENKTYRCNGVALSEAAIEPNDEAKALRDVMLEAVASTDETLMEKYFEGVAFTPDEIRTALRNGMANGDVCPVLCGVQATGEAVPLAAKILLTVAPKADQATYPVEGGVKAIGGGATALYVYKTVADPFVGKLSYFKVLNGEIKADTKLKNARTGAEEKLNKIMIAKAGKQEEIASLCAGDLGCVAKLGDVKTGDTLSADGSAALAPAFPVPSLSMAVLPKAKGEEEKVAAGILRLAEEDPTITFGLNKETGQSVLAGLGEQHIDVVISRLKTKFGVEVTLEAPKVAYRETIRKSVKVQGRHKKQSGGHGQFGDVWIEFEPCEGDELVFEERVVGGAVPKNFFPAVEKGLRESVVNGVLAGFPMVGIKATLYDGSYHPVDSSEMAFKTAASIAFKEGIPQCSPVLLEPFGRLTVVAPDEQLGDVIGEVNKRRGRIIGMNPLPGKMQEVVGEAPIAEMSDFTTAMRSITGGTAAFTLTFERYEQMPDPLAQKVIEAHKKQE